MEEQHWIYQGKEIKSAEDLPNQTALGFIYMITQISTGQKYIGKKLLTKSGTRQVKGVKKKVRLPSDWVSYWSSSPTILALIEEAGSTKDFSKEILVFCKTKGSLLYCEEMALYQVGALESDAYINLNIRSKIYQSWIAKDVAAAKSLRLRLQLI
jgi:hypothetical protein